MRLSDKMEKRKIRRALTPFASQKTSPEHNKETEVKLRVADRQALLRRLARLRASYCGCVHEMNTLYDTPDGALARKGKLLRIRVERPADRPMTRMRRSAKASRARQDSQSALLTFKGPVRRERSSKRRGGRRYKIREEREVRVADGTLLAGVLEALGLRPSFRYEKYRATYRLPGLAGVTVELDETPIGDFLEAEGSRTAIDCAAALLGYQPADYIIKSYGRLFLDESRRSGQASHSRRAKRGRMPGTGSRDMLFGGKK
jgi:adenylate cyclase class IV